MTSSLGTSTVEYFAKQAGIKDTNGQLNIEDDRFEVTAASGEYIARFKRNGHDVAQFTSPTLGRDLTHEEARDLMLMIRGNLSKSETINFIDVLARLENNLPNLGFATVTPLMGQAETRPHQNARQWVWSLSNE